MTKRTTGQPSCPCALKIALILQIETPHGPARVRLGLPPAARAGLVLGHGAGGGIDAPDLQAVSQVALELQLAVALVEQPYRVAGRRSPAPAHQLDAAWLAVIDALAAAGNPLHGLALVFGGRSSGARVACRAAPQGGAVAVLCLAFPLHPPGRSADPGKSRLGELERVEVPVLVIQGERDPFGLPPEGPRREVAVIPGTHSLRDRAAVAAAAESWLSRLAL